MKIRLLPGIAALIMASGLFASQGCVSDPDLENIPIVSFDSLVRPIIAGNCTQAGCHGASNSEAFPLNTYEEIRSNVTPGNARKSTLYRVITGRSGEFMPPSPSNPLTEDQIRYIFIWIEQGALKN